MADMVTGCLTLFDRPCGIGRPLTPRSCVELCAAKARVLEGEQVVACGDARPAVADDLIRRHVADRRRDFRAQFLRRSEQSLLVEIPLEEMILRAGDVTANLVDRFGVAPVALRRARVDEARSSGAGA